MTNSAITLWPPPPPFHHPIALPTPRPPPPEPLASIKRGGDSYRRRTRTSKIYYYYCRRPPSPVDPAPISSRPPLRTTPPPLSNGTHRTNAIYFIYIRDSTHGLGGKILVVFVLAGHETQRHRFQRPFAAFEIIDFVWSKVVNSGKFDGSRDNSENERKGPHTHTVMYVYTTYTLARSHTLPSTLAEPTEGYNIIRGTRGPFVNVVQLGPADDSFELIAFYIM